MSLTKLALGFGIINSPPRRVWLVTSRLGTGKSLTFFTVYLDMFTYVTSFIHIFTFCIYGLLVWKYFLIVLPTSGLLHTGPAQKSKNIPKIFHVLKLACGGRAKTTVSPLGVWTDCTVYTVVSTCLPRVSYMCVWSAVVNKPFQCYTRSLTMRRFIHASSQSCWQFFLYLLRPSLFLCLATACSIPESSLLKVPTYRWFHHYMSLNDAFLYMSYWSPRPSYRIWQRWVVQDLLFNTHRFQIVFCIMYFPWRLLLQSCLFVEMRDFYIWHGKMPFDLVWLNTHLLMPLFR